MSASPHPDDEHSDSSVTTIAIGENDPDDYTNTPGGRGLSSCLKSMHRKDLIDILKTAGENYIEVTKLIHSRLSQGMKDELRMIHCKKSQVLDFTCCLQAARTAIDDADSRVRFLQSWGVIPDNRNDDFTNIIQLITDHCGAFAHPDTRRNALSVLCKMCGMILAMAEGGDYVEERRKYQWDMSLENAIFGIVYEMTLAERLAVVDDAALWPRLVHIYEESDDKLFPGFVEVINEFPKPQNDETEIDEELNVTGEYGQDDIEMTEEDEEEGYTGDTGF
ncbi:hypothetical protein BDV28DRAFT_85218 [Aspergillus coremiiformis]|uniref:Armadillo-type protein n=1 Tax=Aspergillus coremiiformis TaxID=138285 RepID=A0A5N6YT37_9EURO|nr:hypothetical protein BDV28DRAFT_85218 [Aspergillus coremiiformis]